MYGTMDIKFIEMSSFFVVQLPKRFKKGSDVIS
jgi:hypothetical protein